MASLRTDPQGNYLIAFRWAKRQYTRSLDTRDREFATAAAGKVDETLMRLRRGWLAIPEGADPGTFIVSAGTLSERPDKAAVPDGPMTLAALFDRHVSDIPVGAKQASTRLTEKIHRTHLKRILGEDMPVPSVTLAEAQRYAAGRSTEKHNGKLIQSDTIVKELKTLRRIWAWGFKVGLVGADCPWKLRDLQLSKQQSREPFRTFAEIERRIKRGGLTEEEQDRLWECLYLTGEEVKELLSHAKESATAGFVYPMLAFCALTGARRSELCRSRIDDFDFEHGVVHIRERKRDQSRAETLRNVDLSQRLSEDMREWFTSHPGGSHTLSQEGGARVSVDLASSHFKRTLASHKRFCKVPGFHTLRHSFASILASKGVDQRIIDAFMGHQTEEMRARYQHLFPAGRRRAIELLLP